MGAIEGIKILDLTWQGPGPYATMILGDLGADIITIMPPPTAGARQVHQTAHRNKKSIMLNLKAEEGRQIFYQLSSGSDVIVEGFRPGVTKRLGIGYDTISEIHPRIVYCSITGYGQDGPYRELPGHDINYLSFAGALNLIGEPDSNPVIPLNLIADYGAGGKDAAIGILAALMSREKTGKGQHVDISLMDGVISLLTDTVLSQFFNTGKVPNRGEHVLSGAYPFYNVYKTKDGKFITLGCLEPWFWEHLCHEIGREDLIPFNMLHDYVGKPEGAKKYREIISSLKQQFLTRTRDEWYELFAKRDIPIGKVYSLDEVFTDPQVLHRKMVIEMTHPTKGKVKQVGIAIKLSATPGEVRSLPPTPGEHTDEILKSLGYTAQKIDGLRKSGVVG